MKETLFRWQEVGEGWNYYPVGSKERIFVGPVDRRVWINISGWDRPFFIYVHRKGVRSEWPVGRWTSESRGKIDLDIGDSLEVVMDDGKGGCNDNDGAWGF